MHIQQGAFAVFQLAVLRRLAARRKYGHLSVRVGCKVRNNLNVQFKGPIIVRSIQGDIVGLSFLYLQNSDAMSGCKAAAIFTKTLTPRCFSRMISQN